MATKPAPYVTVTQGMRGWFAVLMRYHENGFWEPWQSGIGSYEERENATVEAREWADAEGLQYRD